MTASPESEYRTARRAFIAACEAARLDSIARLNPAKSPDGKPLFMDSVALGPRLGERAVLALANDAAGSAIAVALLQGEILLGRNCRLVLVHALDPAAFAGVPGDPAWPSAMLAAVATEDMSRVKKLAVLPLSIGDFGNALVPVLPKAAVVLLPAIDSVAGARAAIAAYLSH